MSRTSPGRRLSVKGPLRDLDSLKGPFTDRQGRLLPDRQGESFADRQVSPS